MDAHHMYSCSAFGCCGKADEEDKTTTKEAAAGDCRYKVLVVSMNSTETH